MKRYLVFLGRCYLHQKEVSEIFTFFGETSLRQKLLAGNPAFVEQVTRAFFYKDAGWTERIAIVENHVRYLENFFCPEMLEKLYCDHESIELWQDKFQEDPISLVLWFHSGQRKEGCLSLVLRLGETDLYQIMFWLAPGLNAAEPALWIGALQGAQQGNAIIKAMTKYFFGYRTKNLIFYGMRSVAEVLGCNNIYAVTNAGYYAMNHVRIDRKLKTSFGDFWEECGGSPCMDKRFYTIPIKEIRKEMSDLKPSKRANHRRRYGLMDDITAAITANMAPYLRETTGKK
jgi:hypothetical protein